MRKVESEINQIVKKISEGLINLVDSFEHMLYCGISNGTACTFCKVTQVVLSI